jgi:hypothetical protein
MPLNKPMETSVNVNAACRVDLLSLALQKVVCNCVLSHQYNFNHATENGDAEVLKVADGVVLHVNNMEPLNRTNNPGVL